MTRLGICIAFCVFTVFHSHYLGNHDSTLQNETVLFPLLQASCHVADNPILRCAGALGSHALRFITA